MEMNRRFEDGNRPMMYYPPSIFDKVAAAYNKRDWKALNRMAVVWWDPYSERWCKFGPTFWDA